SQGVQVGVAVPDRSDWVGRLIMLDEIMLDSRLLALREDGAEVDLALSDINHALVGRSRGVFHVDHREALRVSVEEVERIATAEYDPVQIHLEIDQRWVCLLE